MSKSGQKLDDILENKVVEKLKFSKNVNNKKCAPKIIFFNEKNIRKIRIIFDIESQNFAIFAIFYSTDSKIWKLFKGLVIGFGSKERPGRMCESVR